MIISADTTSPPTITAPTSAASWVKPAVHATAQATGRSPGAANPTTSAVGTAPIAATSAKLAAAALRPTSTGVDQSRRKWRPSTMRSVVITTLPSGAATIAVSSPGPSITALAAPAPDVMRWIRPNSPKSEIVPSGESTISTPLTWFRR